MTIVTERRYTPEDLLALPDGERFELVDGRLVETKMGTEAGGIAGNIIGLLFIWNRQAKYGWVLSAEASYQCFGDEADRVRRPDVSFIRTERLPGLPRGHTRIPPDLAVEVVSPNDLYSEVREKVEEYLVAGVRLIWIVAPDTRSIEVVRADGTVSLLHADDELAGEDVLPDFRCGVCELFPPAVQDSHRL
jgi:Uma2 family endonuclease